MDPLVRRMERMGRHDLAVEGLVLQALALQSKDDVASALVALERALALAEPGGYVRLFVDEGEPMAKLLRRVAYHGTKLDYVGKLLAAFPDSGRLVSESLTGHMARTSPSRMVEPLSKRELEVLRLLAAGMSNPEIADELFIAVSTVRSHCKSIYGKLGVHKRWDAVQRAQELDLI
jgi:LuxR family maltose regulon positive regulatory protein